MNQTLEGVSRIVRVTRTPLSVVAIAIIVPVVFSAVVLLFADIHPVAKYFFAGLPWAVVLIVWFQFWSKAKTEPLSASEEYHMQELRYKYLGVEEDRVTIDQVEAQRRVTDSQGSRLTAPDQESDV